MPICIFFVRFVLCKFVLLFFRQTPWYAHLLDQLIGLRFPRWFEVPQDHWLKVPQDHWFWVPQGVVLDDTLSLPLLSLIELLFFYSLLLFSLVFLFVNIFIFVTIVDRNIDFYTKICFVFFFLVCQYIHVYMHGHDEQ